MDQLEPTHSRYSAWQELLALRGAADLIAEVAALPVGNELTSQKKLRQKWSEGLVRAAFALVDARRRGAGKFSRADAMWFERKGLEQATPEIVARHKSLRFQGDVLDLCCGIGGDATALAARGNVVSVDLDPVACQWTEWNAEVYQVATNLRTECRSVETCDVSGRLVHLDPDRRQSGQKAVRLEDYVPGPAFIEQIMQTATGGAIKLSPAANFVGRFPEAEIELISLNGECKEATVWFGSLRGDDPWRATVLPSGKSLAGHPLDHVADLTEPLGYLIDPDPAVVRSGLVDLAANQLNASRLDAEEEYLTSANPIMTPFGQTFEILAVLSNNDAEIRKHFRNSNFGQVEIKCRHVPIRAEEIRRKLPLPGVEPGVLVYARVGGRTKALVCKRLARNESDRM